MTIEQPPGPGAQRGDRRYTRRRVLGSAAGVAGAAVGFDLLPQSVRGALADTAANRPGGGLESIEHVVLLMQENRSFDHYFGTMPGVRGFGDPAAKRLSTGRPVFYQPDADNPDGYTLPFHLDTKTTSAQSIPSTSHAWDVQHSALNGGAMDSWLPAHRAADGVNGPYVMGYYERDDIPFQFALADAFTVCDHYHCSVLGPTWPNRLYWMTASIDPNGLNGGPITYNGTPNGPYTWTTYAERLEAAGVSWKVYQEADNYGTNMLSGFVQFQNAQPGDPLYDNGMARQPAGTFESDAANDNLPAVSWILPTSTGSEHPDYLPAAGADFVAGKIEAIASNPKVWAKTVFILNYDENDGLFDHVVPQTAPPGTPDEYVQGLPIGAGFRVPCIIVSPWTAGGWVCSEQFDHTSILQFLERFTGVQEPNISQWRRRSFGDLTSAFRFGEPARFTADLGDTAAELATAEQEVADNPAPTLPGADQSMPRQQFGIKPHIPPYLS